MPDPSRGHVALQRALDRLLARPAIGHAVLAVESEDGTFRWIGAAGDADGSGRPMTGQTPFYLASVTKTYTAVLVLRLVEQGRLELDEPITSYLPESLTDRIHVHRGTDHSARITVRHLLANTSGLANYFEDRPKGEPSLSTRLFTEGDRSWSTQDVADMLRDQLKPFFPPGRGLRYSDTNFQLIEAIVEHAADAPFHEQLRAQVLAPLGLSGTYLAGYPPSTNSPPPAALFYRGTVLHMPQAMKSIGAQGALISTVEECFTFARALFAGRLFEKAETLALMMSGWRRFGLPLDAAALRAPSWPIEYSLGLMRFRLPRLLNGMQPMTPIYGHTGSSGSWLFYAPERGLYFAGTVDEVTSAAVPYRLVPNLLRQLPADLSA